MSLTEITIDFVDGSTCAIPLIDNKITIPVEKQSIGIISLQWKTDNPINTPELVYGKVNTEELVYGIDHTILYKSTVSHYYE